MVLTVTVMVLSEQDCRVGQNSERGTLGSTWVLVSGRTRRHWRQRRTM